MDELYDIGNEQSVETKNKIISLLNEGKKMKEVEIIQSLWSEDDDRELKILQDCLDLFDMGQDELAISEFQSKSKLSYQDTFKDYFSSKPSMNLDALRFTGKTTSKAKAYRATSKIDKCPYCGSATKISGNKMVCTNTSCGNVIDIESKSVKVKAFAMKHTKNKIEMLVGDKDPPKKIVELYPCIEVWLTNLDYLYDWLAYQETFKFIKNRVTMGEWLTKFRKIYKPRGTGMWKMQIPKTKQFAWTYPEYKMIITQFHSMLMECGRLAQAQFISSNMNSLSDEKIIEIFKSYVEVNGKIKPNVGEIFNYNGENYDVGNFLNQLALTLDDSDLKQEIDKLFGENIRIPGLMTNFLILRSKKIDRFALTESYSYIIHRVFEISQIFIPNTDIEKMVDLIQEFDNYVQKNNPTTSVKKSNSKLYTCKLRCILQLPYFFKYAEIAEYMPVKSEDTTAKIAAEWDRFETNEGLELVKKYHEVDEIETEEPTKKKIFELI